MLLLPRSEWVFWSRARDNRQSDLYIIKRDGNSHETVGWGEFVKRVTVFHFKNPAILRFSFENRFHSNSTAIDDLGDSYAAATAVRPNVISFRTNFS